jgi:hypothetical protein
MQRFSGIFALAVSIGSATATAQSAPSAQRASADSPSTAVGLLDQLVGTWRMVGQVRGRPASYDLEARRVLGGHFVELHMTDAGRPATYEARVFIGEDTTAGKIFVHWMDNFGAAFSVPAAAGAVAGDTVRFEFAYSSGPFRDTFVYHRAANAWTFRLESGDDKAGWRPFALYEVQRSGEPSHAAPGR